MPELAAGAKGSDRKIHQNNGQQNEVGFEGGKPRRFNTVTGVFKPRNKTNELRRTWPMRDEWATEGQLSNCSGRRQGAGTLLF